MVSNILKENTASIFNLLLTQYVTEKILINFYQTTRSRIPKITFLFIVKTLDVLEVPYLGIFSNIQGKALKSVAAILTYSIQRSPS